METTAQDAVTSGDAIVVATISRVRDPVLGCAGGGSALSKVHVDIEVTEVIAGPASLGRTQVLTNADGGMCGLSVEEGETWVLQLFGDGPFIGSCTAAREIEGDQDAWLVELRDAAGAGS